jgi:DNA-binding NarL/FixJ family response regulator
MAESGISVLIAEDSSAFRSGLRALLASASDMNVVGEAEDGTAAVRLAFSLQPDVVLMDLQMPGTNGIEATRQVIQSCPHIAVVMLTMFEDDESVFAAMQAGARGYLLKGTLRNEILAAVRAAAAGEAIFGPALAKRMMQYFAQLRAPAVPFPDLTERERDVLGLIAQGRNNTEIADMLVLSPKTVRNYITSIFDKLQVADRAQAVLRARDAGLR